MPFVYNEQKSAAIDDAAGISVHRSRQFNDDERLFTYEYSSKEVSFEFDAIIARERRSYTHKGKTFERDQDVAYYVCVRTHGTKRLRDSLGEVAQRRAVG
jgi:hypothetical protein